MLEVSAISKTFGRKSQPALDRVEFDVQQGSICGLLGHNGAGKSTALGIILGMVFPDEGEVTISGVSVQRNRETAIRKIGAIFETPAFYEYLSGRHNLKILSSYSGGVSRESMDETVEWVGLSERIDDRVSTYSHGMRQRLALAQALLPRPELLVLDEPTDGLDPEGIVEFRKQLLELRDRFGLTVLLSSHLLSEAGQVCDEVVILQKGVKVYEGKVSGVTEDRLVYEIAAEDGEKLRELVVSKGGEPVGDDFSFPIGTNASELLTALVEGGARISRFGAKSDSLEALYLKISEEAKR